MNSTNNSQLIDFLHCFDIKTLGDGEINAGINTLTAMACTLGNIARPQSGFLTKKGKLLRPTTDLLITDSLSAQIVDDTVINELHMRQGNLSNQLQRALSEEKKAHDNNHFSSQKTALSHRFPRSSNNALQEILHNDPYILGDTVPLWGTVTTSPPPPTLESIVKGSNIIMDIPHQGTGSKNDSATLQPPPLIILKIPHPTQKRSYSASEQRAIEDGHLLALAPYECLQHHEASTYAPLPAWISSTLWLGNKHAGPLISDESPEHTPKSLNNIFGRFRSALTLAFGRRLNVHDPAPNIIKLDIDSAHNRWIEFLIKMEPALPGISGTARNLLVSLLFGIHELVSVTPPKKGFSYTIKNVEALAQHLIHRMANTHNLIKRDSKNNRRQKLQDNILRKLKDGGQTPRELTRRFNRLTAPECLEALNHLQEDGKVTISNNQYFLSEGQRSSTLTLEV